MSLGSYLKTRGGPIWDKGRSHGGPVCGPYMTKGGHGDLIRSPKGSIWHPYRAVGNPMEMNSPFCFLIFCEILFCLLLTFSFITFSLLTQIQTSWSFSNREGNGHKENIYGIFTEHAQKVENIAKNKVERELVDTLYISKKQ